MERSKKGIGCCGHSKDCDGSGFGRGTKSHRSYSDETAWDISFEGLESRV
jgi:hypothetical protein